MTATSISAIPLGSFTLIQSRKAEKTHMEETNATMLIPHNEKNNYAAKQN